MFRAIMVPHDGTEASGHALPWAIAAAGLASAEGPRAALHLVHVPEPAVPPAALMGDAVMMAVTLPTDAVATRHALDALVTRLRATGLAATAAVDESQSPARALRAYAKTHGIDLIVMSTHARGGVGRAMLGSVADELVRESGLPVLLTRRGDLPPAAVAAADDARPATIRRILVTLDGTPAAEEILPHAASLREATGAQCTLLRVVEPMLASGVLAPPALVDEEAERQDEVAALAYLETMASRVGRDVATRVLSGRSAAGAITEHLRVERADVIALATHGRRGMARAFQGSTEGALLRKTDVPLLVVRSSAAVRRDERE